MRRPQVKPCQGRYNITARVKAGSHHTTSRAWQHRETLQDKVFISGDGPSSDQAAAPAVSSRQPKEDGRRAPPELTDSRSFSLPSARCRWEQAPGRLRWLGYSCFCLAPNLQLSTREPESRNCLQPQHSGRERRSSSTGPHCRSHATDGVWANIAAPSPPVGSDSAAGRSRTGTAPAVAIHVTPAVTASDFVFPRTLVSP